MQRSLLASLVVWLCLMIPGQLQAQQEYIVKNYGLIDGLPLNAVNDVEQDSTGYLYLATQEGLVRYDGYRMTTFNALSQPSLPFERITHLHYDTSNLLWLYHPSGNITAFDGQSFTTFGPQTNIGFIQYFREDNSGGFWVISDTGIFSFNRETSSFEQYPVPEYVGTMTIVTVDYLGGLLGIAEDGKIWSFGVDTFRLVVASTPITRQYTKQFLSSVDPHLIWLRDVSGYYAIDRQSGQIVWRYATTASLSKSIHKLRDGRYLLMTEYMYLYLDPTDWSYELEPIEITYFLSLKSFIELADETYIRMGSNELKIGEITLNNIRKPTAIFVDRKGTIWVPSQSDGLYRISSSSVQNLHIIDKVPLVNIYSIYECRINPGTFRFATYESGIVEYDGTRARILNNTTSNLPSGILQFMYQDFYGNHYAGYRASGLWKQVTPDNWQRDEGMSELFPGLNVTVYGMHHDPSVNVLYVGNGQGLVVQENGTWRKIYDHTGSELLGVRVFTPLPEVMMLGTINNGIYLMDATRTIRRQLTTKDGLSSNFIRDIYVQSSDTLWVVTENAGLNRLVRQINDDYLITVVDHRDGLPHNNVHRMLTDQQGRVWISSNRGIFSTTLAALNAAADEIGSIITFIRIDETSGMLNREANGGVSNTGFLTTDARLFFSNQRGVTVLDPEAIYESLTYEVPTPVIEKISDNQLTWFSDVEGYFSIPLGLRSFTVHFTAPNIMSQQQVALSYMLQDIDMTWQVATTNHSARYTNLGPGEYQFLVKSAQIDGSYKMATKTIQVPHFVRETVWFQVLVVASGMVLFVFFVNYRDKKLTQIDRIQQIVDAQIFRIKQVTEEKSRFFYGITHDLRHMMTLITGPLEIVREQVRGQAHVQEDLLQLMDRNAIKIMDMTEQMMEVARLSNDEWQLQLKPAKIVEETQRAATLTRLSKEDTPFHVIIHPSEQSPTALIDKSAWERIVANLISNAHIHGYSSKGLHVYFVCRQKELDVIFRDFGKGVPADNTDEVFAYMGKGSDSAGSGLGLYVVRELVHRMQGTIRAEHIPLGGSRFIITLRCTNPASEPRHLVADTSESGFKLLAQADTSKPLTLLVEDDPDTVRYWSDALRMHFRVVAARNGLEALETAIESRPDIVISDVIMPIMDGPTFVQQLRETEDFSTIPVVFLSDNNDPDAIATGLSSGADVYISKNVVPGILISQLKALLRREQLIRERTTESVISPEEHPLTREITAIIYRNLSNPTLSADMIAGVLHLSRSSLYRDWKKTGEVTLRQYIMELRLREARILLEQDGYAVSLAAQAVGIRDAGYFSTLFKKHFGFSPTETKKQR